MKKLLSLILLVILCNGCQVQGHRKFEIEVLGSTFRIEDEVLNNTNGEDKYNAGFDETSSFTKWLFGSGNDKPNE